MKSSKISRSIISRLRKAAGNRCGYCLSPQQYVLGKLEIEHIVPRSLGGNDEESNLWLSCSLCNRFKGAQVNGIDPRDGSSIPLYNPRRQYWHKHFYWSKDGTKIIGKTPAGRATVEALRLNNEVAVEVRCNWVLAGWHPPEE